MKYDPNIHHRRLIRLPGYDYSQSMVLNQYGMVVMDEWQKSALIRREIKLDACVVMPNHFHGIVMINNNRVGANGGQRPYRARHTIQQSLTPMKYDPNIHHRRSIRLPGYDYRQSGAYFVTICAYQRQCLFGDIVNGQMILNQSGMVVADEWQKSALIRREIKLDAWVVMPNHFHGIVIINNNVGANGRSPLHNGSPVRIKPQSLSSLMAGFKSITTKKINILRDAPGIKLWQRNYYEHIIRNQDAMDKIRQYIINNPVSWEIDQLHPDNPSKW